MSVAVTMPALNSAGGNALMETLEELRGKVSRREVKATADQFEVIIHSHASGRHADARRLYPSVTLRNGYVYRLRQQRCREPGCNKRGFSLRDWHARAVSRGWHPPMSGDEWGMGSAEQYVRQNLESDFGPHF